MAYSLVDNVQTLIKWTTFTTSTKVTTTEITNFYIPEADTYIDARLERVYVVPITDSDDIEILKYISCRLAAAEVAKTLVLQTAGKIPEIVQMWLTDAEKRLAEICSYEVDLPNSTKLDSKEGLYSYTAHGVDNDGNDPPEQTWVIGEEQW